MLSNFLKTAATFVFPFLLTACDESSHLTSESADKTFSVFMTSIVGKGGYELFSADLLGSVADLSHGLLSEGGVLDFKAADSTGMVAFTVYGQNPITNLYVGNLRTLERNAVTNFTSTVAISRSARIREYLWNPNGNQLAYIVISPDVLPRFSLNIFSVESGASLKLALQVDVGQLYWSPDGRYLAFVGINSGLGSQDELLVLNVETQEVTKIAINLMPNDRVYLSDNSWSPLSSQLIFQINHFSGAQRVNVANVTGESQIELSLVDSDSVDRWRWSPDGARLAFISDHEVPNYWQLYAVEPSTENLIRISQPEIVDGWVNEFYWSPNGESLAYVTYGTASPSLYSVRPDSTEHRKISEPLSVYQQGTVWSPGGEKLAFAAYHTPMDSTLFIHSSEGNERASIVRQDNAPYELIDRPIWSQTGLFVVFEGLSDWVTDIYVVNAAGTIVSRVSADLLGLALIGDAQWANGDETVVYIGSELLAGREDIYTMNRVEGKTSCITCSVEKLDNITSVELVSIH